MPVGAEALPGVSVVIAARDAAKTLPDTLAAVFAQDYDGPLEVIVADGAGIRPPTTKPPSSSPTMAAAWTTTTYAAST